MPVEIERKFLVLDLSAVSGVPGTPIRQGFLSTDPERVVRVRVAGPRAFVTIKGRTVGISRSEYEYEVPVAEADEMLARLALRPLVEKTRYKVAFDGLVWEVDVFSGENTGLVVAEVELPAEDAAVALPAWVGREVTADRRYYNANLVGHPYREWGRR